MRIRNMAQAVRARIRAALWRDPASPAASADPGTVWSGGSPRRRRVVAGVATALSVVATAGGLTFTATVPAQADVTDGLILDYPLDEFSGNVAYDSSGNNRDGTVNGTVSWKGNEGLAFNGSDTYIKMPDNLMAGLSSITVDFDVWIDPTMGKPYFLYGMGNSSNGSGNGYLFSTGNQFRTGITQSDFHAEQQTRPSTSYQLARGMWKHVTYTQTGSTGILYENGAEKARNTSVAITPGAIGNGTTAADYIGRSLYSTDLYFKGRMRDFRLYNRALAAKEVAERANWRDVQWQQLQALADNNGVLAMWQADTGVTGGNGAWMIVPADYPDDKYCAWCLVAPTGWTSDYGVVPTEWPQPDVLVRSQFTQQQINDIEDAVVNRVQPTSDTLVRDTTYNLKYFYDGPSDTVVVQTDAPTSVTDPLKTAYPGKVTIQALPGATPAGRCTNDTGTAGEVSELPADPTEGMDNDRTDLEWQQVEALRDYNCALAAYDDPTTGPVLVFPSDSTDLSVVSPSNWTSPFGQKPTDWPKPTTKKSAQFTLLKIKEIQAAVLDQLSPEDVADGSPSYVVSVYYDGRSDRVVVETDAPSSATDPLVTAYPNQITIKPYTPPTAAPEPAEQAVN
ncbi:LamG domain-containing protein [Streptomyces arenae]|uniref:LamG domain-containing protein n=1 Tax=Streptomyces arenae TaxID=29301 RepID=UPI002658BFB8|nr:LamG domain-containing protein [Streptomyces arenae]MCG7210072.1 LamG domain-containing protein [Streptomyces arenae]